MKEEIPKNEELIIKQQTARVQSRLGNMTRRQVKPCMVIAWYLLALLTVAAWAYRLLGLYSLPF